MDVFLVTLVAIGTAVAVEWLRGTNNQPKEDIMAAIDNLEAALLGANTKLETLQAAVDRIVAEVDPAKEQRIEQVASNTVLLGNALVELKGRIEAVVPPPAE